MAAEGILTELGTHKRALFAACLGMGAGYLINHYIAGLFAPHLLAEFGWSRGDFAKLGSLGLLTVFVVPVVGRLTDLFGMKPVALVGVISYPLCFLALAAMEGSLAMFAIITVVQQLLAGVTTSSMAYSRVVAERFTVARGLALALAATSPALVGMIGAPFLHEFIEANGWRAGYVAVAAFVGFFGGLCLLLLPGGGKHVAVARTRRRASEDYPKLLRAPALWAIVGAFLLCNLLYPLQSSQMSLMLQESGASSKTASWLISLFAGGVMTGRFVCGLALDKFPTPVVAAIALGLPGFGLMALASGLHALPVLALAVFVMGTSLGSESDLAAYLSMRYFRLELYGTAMGLIVTSMSVSTALGALVLGFTLDIAGNFRVYMALAGILTLVGASFFLLLGRESVASSGLGETGESE